MARLSVFIAAPAIGGCGALPVSILRIRMNGKSALSERTHAPKKIDGRYSNVGHYSKDAAYYSSLIPAYATDLTYRLGGSLSQSYIADIQYKDETLTLDAILEGEKKDPYTLRMAYDDFRCQSGVHWIKPRIETGGDGTGVYRTSNSLGLQMSADGDLIGEDRTSGIGAVLWMIPIAGSQSHWYRWSKLDPRL